MLTLQERFSGILVHPTSFPSPYGIGDFGPAAYDFIDFLAESGQKLWQVLPLGPTGFGDSPYQAFSAFAGQPLLISPELLINDQLLTKDDLNTLPEFDDNRVDYGYIIPFKQEILHKAHKHYTEGCNPALIPVYQLFCEKEAGWLDDYALFMAGKDAHDGRSWLEWEDELRDPTPEIKAEWSEKLSDSIDYYKFIQFLFFRQWQDIRNYARIKRVKIVGDIPIFVALDSADVWACRELFQLDSNGYPTVVAGVPPDYFSATGQLWGNPLYNWDYHAKNQFDWWVNRIAMQMRMVDYLRVDHFRGFEAYYAIPYGETTAMHGEWRKSPGEALFRQVRRRLGSRLPIWAEDLGIITKDVELLRDEFHLPGMKILQFAFSNIEDNELLPHHFTTANCICYTGTHDNSTTVGWYCELSEEHKDKIRRYLNTDARTIHLDMIRTAMSSIAKYCVFPIQDLFGLGDDCRMNTPSVPMGNWEYRYRPEQLTSELAGQLHSMTELYGRKRPIQDDEPETIFDAVGQEPPIPPLIPVTDDTQKLSHASVLTGIVRRPYPIHKSSKEDNRS